mgnify:CR=1 FL=1
MGPGLSPKTVRSVHMLLHAALEQAVRAGIIAKNPTMECKPPKLEQKEMKVNQPQQIGNYLQAWKEGISLYYLNSIIVTVITVILILLVSTLAAYAVTRFPFKYKKILLGNTAWRNVCFSADCGASLISSAQRFKNIRYLCGYDYSHTRIPDLVFNLSAVPAFHSFPKVTGGSGCSGWLQQF